MVNISRLIDEVYVNEELLDLLLAFKKVEVDQTDSWKKLAELTGRSSKTRAAHQMFMQAITTGINPLDKANYFDIVKALIDLAGPSKNTVTIPKNFKEHILNNPEEVEKTALEYIYRKTIQEENSGVWYTLSSVDKIYFLVEKLGDDKLISYAKNRDFIKLIQSWFGEEKKVENPKPIRNNPLINHPQKLDFGNKFNQTLKKINLKNRQRF